jgi:hypothetical protein
VKKAIVVVCASLAIAGAQTKINGSRVIEGTLNYCSDSGSTDSYACDLQPALAGYTTGACYTFRANSANTGAAAVNFNSLGSKAIKKSQGGASADLADNDIRAGQLVQVCYDGTVFQMESLAGGSHTHTAADVVSSSKQGDGAKFQMFGSGTPAANDCAKFDAAGNLISAGAACAGSSAAMRPTDPSAVWSKSDFLGDFGFAGNTKFYTGDQMFLYFNDVAANWASSQYIDAPNVGVIEFSTGTTANQKAGLTHVGGSSFGKAMNHTNTPWELNWVFRFPGAGDSSNVRLKVGAVPTSWGSVSWPATGVGVRYDSAADTSLTFYAEDGGTTGVLASGVAPGVTWHLLKVRADGTTNQKVWMSLDGGTEKSACASGCDLAIPGAFDYTRYYGPFAGIQTTDAMGKKLDVDYYSWYFVASSTQGRR